MLDVLKGKAEAWGTLTHQQAEQGSTGEGLTCEKPIKDQGLAGALKSKAKDLSPSPLKREGEPPKGE